MPRDSKPAKKVRYFAKPELDADVDLRIAMFGFIRRTAECTMKMLGKEFPRCNEKKRYKIVAEFCRKVVGNEPIVRRRKEKDGRVVLYVVVDANTEFKHEEFEPNTI